MMKWFIRGLDWLARLCYMAGRSRYMKTSLFLICALAFGALVWVRTVRTYDYTIYNLTPRYIQATLINRYVRATGNLLYDGAYDVKSPLLGVFWQNARFIPMTIPGINQPLEVLDQGLPQNTPTNGPVTLVGRMLVGQDDYPDYYLKVMDPPSVALYDALAWLCLSIVGGVILGLIANLFVRHSDYAIDTPFGMSDSADSNTTNPFVLWFGSLGAGYADVVLRQIPVTFRAIPAEARLAPAGRPDSWAIMIRRLRMVETTIVATSYGALPAMRIEFEDERGITRKGLVAASNRSLMDQMLDVMRFVGQ
jgi:hypothetical protein